METALLEYTATALVDSGRRHVDAAKGDGAGDPDFCVENLALLPQLLWKHFDIESGSSVTPGAQKFDKPTAETAAASAAAVSSLPWSSPVRSNTVKWNRVPRPSWTGT